MSSVKAVWIRWKRQELHIDRLKWRQLFVKSKLNLYHHSTPHMFAISSSSILMVVYATRWFFVRYEFECANRIETTNNDVNERKTGEKFKQCQ